RVLPTGLHPLGQQWHRPPPTLAMPRNSSVSWDVSWPQNSGSRSRPKQLQDHIHLSPFLYGAAMDPSYQYMWYIRNPPHEILKPQGAVKDLRALNNWSRP